MEIHRKARTENRWSVVGRYSQQKHRHLEVIKDSNQTEKWKTARLKSWRKEARTYLHSIPVLIIIYFNAWDIVLVYDTWTCLAFTCLLILIIFHFFKKIFYVKKKNQKWSRPPCHPLCWETRRATNSLVLTLPMACFGGRTLRMPKWTPPISPAHFHERNVVSLQWYLKHYAAGLERAVGWISQGSCSPSHGSLGGSSHPHVLGLLPPPLLFICVCGGCAYVCGCTARAPVCGGPRLTSGVFHIFL